MWFASHIAGSARFTETRDTAREIGLCDSIHDAAAAAEGADLVILCVPVGAMRAVMEEIAPVLKPGCVISDVGSVKRAVIDAVELACLMGHLYRHTRLPGPSIRGQDPVCRAV